MQPFLLLLLASGLTVAAFRQHRNETDATKLEKLRREAEEGVRQAQRMQNSIHSGVHEMGGR